MSISIKYADYLFQGFRSLLAISKLYIDAVLKENLSVEFYTDVYACFV